MKIIVVRLWLCALAFSIFNFQSSTAFAQGTAFSYQGQLNTGGSPAGGLYDFTFAIFNASTDGSPASLTLTNSAVGVTNGLFTTTLDFGSGIFTGTNCWLEIAVRATGTTNFTTLFPRQPLLPVPYAIFANTASNLSGTLPAAQLSGTLPSSAFAGYTNTVTLTNGANLFGGNGGGLTNVNVVNLTGVLADSQLAANTAFVNSNQTFSGANNLTNWGNNFVGSFFGNGLVGWVVTNGAAIQAQIDHGYLLTNSQVVTVTLPTNANAGDIVRISGAGAGGWQLAQNTGQSVLGNFSSFANSSWTLTSASSSSQDWSCIASSADGSKLIAAIYGGGIYVSIDSGLTWTETNSTAGDWRSVACSSDGSKLFATRWGGGIYTNSTTGWGIGGSTSGLDWISVAASADGSKLVAAANGNGIFTSTNSGSTWNSQTVSGLPASPNLYFVASSADGTKLAAVVNVGRIYTSANSGVSWTQQNAASSANWVSIASSADGSKLAAVAVSGGIYTSVNSGVAWTQQTNGAPANTNWASIASSADGSKLVALVHGGGVYLSSNSGTTWMQQTNVAAENWYASASSSDGTKLAATAYVGNIYTSQVSAQNMTTAGANGYLTGSQSSAVELQCIGNNQWMPVSFSGTIWAY